MSSIVYLKLLAGLVSQHAARADDVKRVSQKLISQKLTTEEVIREIASIPVYKGQEEALIDVCNKIHALEAAK